MRHGAPYSSSRCCKKPLEMNRSFFVAGTPHIEKKKCPQRKPEKLRGETPRCDEEGGVDGKGCWVQEINLCRVVPHPKSAIQGRHNWSS